MSDPIRSPGTVLVTEDEPMVRAVVVETLLDAGYTVQEACDGMEALETLEAGGIDLLITDIQMPRMNGYQLAQAAMAQWPNLKIMLMTGYAREGVPPAIASANLPTLKKPFDLDRLPGLVSELLAQK